MSQEYKHPIEPPPELVLEWRSEWIHNAPGDLDELGFVAARAARWAADTELEACVEWISKQNWTWTRDKLLAARRPEPPSLKEQSIALIDLIQGNYKAWDISDLDVIRKALEQLND